MFGSGSMKDPIICLPKETIKDLNLTPGEEGLVQIGLTRFSSPNKTRRWRERRSLLFIERPESLDCCRGPRCNCPNQTGV